MVDVSAAAVPPAAIGLVEIPCPLCGGSAHRPVTTIWDATYDIPGTYHIVRCAKCRHLYLNPRPDRASLMACYPADYAPHGADDLSQVTGDVASEPHVCRQKAATYRTLDPAAAQPTEGIATDDAATDGTAARDDVMPDQSTRPGLMRRALRRIPGLRKFLNWLGQESATWLPVPPLPGRSQLLEIGCAHGGFLQTAAEAGWQVDGIEPSERAAAIARGKGLDVFCGDLQAAKLPNASRQAVVMWMVLEHVPNPRETVAEIARILDSGGVFALSVPNAATWERWMFGRYWLGYDAPRHLQIFTARRLKQLVSEQGFTNVRVLYQSGTRYWWGSLAAWGRRRFPSALWPERWMHYFRTDPPSAWHWLLLVPGKMSSLLRCSGRITVIAEKR